MKKLFTTSLIILASTVFSFSQEIGLYFSPIGAGYTQFTYQYNDRLYRGGDDARTLPLRGRGFNAASNGFITLRFNRLRLGVDGTINRIGIRELQTPVDLHPSVGDFNTNWRNLQMGGGRIGYDIIRAPFFALSPTFTMGTFTATRDDFNEEMSRRLFTKYSMLFEFKLPGFVSIFAEPNFSSFRYKIDGLSNNITGRMYNYNVNVGMGLRF
ncbi:MAG: hypothetical protein ACK4ND_04575 [Cytophagaceae bacterium]